MSGFPLLTSLVLLALTSIHAGGQAVSDKSWATEFPVEKGELAANGRNPYFILEPGYQLVLEGGRERLTITVKDEIWMIAGVETRLVEEYETQAGQVVEVSRNYFAISKRTNDLFYFGEDVDIYARGKVVAHDGAWLAGVKGATFGLMMPGQPQLKMRYYQEIAPGVAMDRVEVVGLGETVKTPAGEFKNCLKTEETTPLEPGDIAHKYYAPGIGLVQSDSLKLVKYGKVQASTK